MPRGNRVPNSPGKWVKGQSGNPGGKHKDTHLMRAAARLHWEDSIRVTAEILNDKKVQAAVRLAAANSLLDRGFGKPTQEIEVARRPLEDMTDDELAYGAELIRRALSEVADGIPSGDEAAEGVEPPESVSSLH
jgi:hypothetical protein